MNAFCVLPGQKFERLCGFWVASRKRLRPKEKRNLYDEETGKRVAVKLYSRAKYINNAAAFKWRQRTKYS